MTVQISFRQKCQSKAGRGYDEMVSVDLRVGEMFPFHISKRYWVKLVESIQSIFLKRKKTSWLCVLLLYFPQICKLRAFTCGQSNQNVFINCFQAWNTINYTWRDTGGVMVYYSQAAKVIPLSHRAKNSWYTNDIILAKGVWCNDTLCVQLKNCSCLTHILCISMPPSDTPHLSFCGFGEVGFVCSGLHHCETWLTINWWFMTGQKLWDHIVGSIKWLCLNSLHEY